MFLKDGSEPIGLSPIMTIYPERCILNPRRSFQRTYIGFPKGYHKGSFKALKGSIRDL